MDSSRIHVHVHTQQMDAHDAQGRERAWSGGGAWLGGGGDGQAVCQAIHGERAPGDATPHTTVATATAHVLAAGFAATDRRLSSSKAPTSTFLSPTPPPRPPRTSSQLRVVDSYPCAAHIVTDDTRGRTRILTLTPQTHATIHPDVLRILFTLKPLPLLVKPLPLLVSNTITFLTMLGLDAVRVKPLCCLDRSSRWLAGGTSWLWFSTR